MPVRVVLEVAPKKAFASALDWPGWARAGRTEDDALQSLVDYGARYAVVARRAQLPFAHPATVRGLDIVERLRGNGTTEFGAPGKSARAEEQPVSGADLARLVALLEASWAILDAVAKKAAGVKLSTGPRGGGRDLDKIIGHVRDAESAYLHKLGARAPDPEGANLRRAFTDALTALAAGRPVDNPSRTRNVWSPRYATRRAAWHVLDHAWEIEDRSPD